MLAHIGIIGAVLLLALGCFGQDNLRQLGRGYRRELLWALAIAAGFYAFLTAVYALWQPLAGVVLACTKALLGWQGIESEIVPPYTLLFDKFGVTIAQTCSGIESIALFSGLYAIVGLLDWQQLDHRRYLVVFPLALALLFGLNIIRVYLLIVAGYYIDPQIAFSLFHTYAGMVFFILYSVAFWLTTYKHLLRKPPRSAAA
jgi:exosortase/archaeosortase family protein